MTDKIYYCECQNIKELSMHKVKIINTNFFFQLKKWILHGRFKNLYFMNLVLGGKKEHGKNLYLMNIVGGTKEYIIQEFIFYELIHGWKKKNIEIIY